MRELIGKSWAVPCDPPNTFDCWELVRHVRKIHGKFTPSVVDARQRLPSHRRYIEEPPVGWKQLDDVALWCVVRIGNRHVGVYIGGGDVMHVPVDRGVKIDSLRHLTSATIGVGSVSFWELDNG